MKNKVLAIIITVLAPVSLIAGVITEQQAVDSALKNNPALISAWKLAGSYEAKSHKEFFLPNPMVGFDIMGVKADTVDLNSSMQKYLMVTQVVPFPLKYIWKAGGAMAEADMYRYMYEMKRNEAVSSARTAYYRLYETMKDIEITTEAVSVLKQLSDTAFAKYNQGMATQMETSKADLEKALLENDLLNLYSKKETDMQALRRAAGDDTLLSGPFTLEDPAIPGIKTDFEGIRSLVLANSPGIKAASSGLAMSGNMRNMAIADYIPDLNVQFKKSVDPGSSDYELMLEFEIPLFFLNNQQADIGEKWDMAASKESDLKNAQDAAVQEAREHFDTMAADFRSMDLYKNKLIPQAQAALKSALSSYQSRKIEFMELLDSERMLLDMKKDYYMKMTEYLMHYRMLEELIGKQMTNE